MGESAGAEVVAIAAVSLFVVALGAVDGVGGGCLLDRSARRRQAMPPEDPSE